MADRSAEQPPLSFTQDLPYLLSETSPIRLLGEEQQSPAGRDRSVVPLTIPMEGDVVPMPLEPINLYPQPSVWIREIDAPDACDPVANPPLASRNGEGRGAQDL